VADRIGPTAGGRARDGKSVIRHDDFKRSQKRPDPTALFRRIGGKLGAGVKLARHVDAHGERLVGQTLEERMSASGLAVPSLPE
jgi:hypothetical protein